MPPTKSGSKKVAIALSIARRSARKGKKYADGGEVEMPLWLESGLVREPRGDFPPPRSERPPSVSQIYADRPASLRKTPEPVLDQGDLGAMAAVPVLGRAFQGARALKAGASMLAGTGLLMSGDEAWGATKAKSPAAAPAEPSAPEITGKREEDIKARLKWIDNVETFHATTRTPSAQGTQKARLDSLGNEKRILLQELTAMEHEKKPFVEKFPEAKYAMPAAVLGSLGANALLATRGKPLKSMAWGAATGAGTSGAVGSGPTIYEASPFQSEGPVKEAAQKRVGDENFWMRSVLPEAGLGAAAGALGGAYGAKIKEGIGNAATGIGNLLRRGTGSSAAPSEAVAAAVPQVNRPLTDSIGRQIYKRPDGKWRYGNHRVVSQDELKTLRSQYPDMASGGRVLPWEGGGFAPYEVPLPRRRPELRDVPMPRPRPSDAVEIGPQEAPAEIMPEEVLSLPPEEAPSMPSGLQQSPPPGGLPSIPPFMPLPGVAGRLARGAARVAPPAIQRFMNVRPSGNFPRGAYRDPETGRFLSRPPAMEGMQAGGSVGGREWTSGLMRQQTTHDRLKGQEEGMERRQQQSHGQVEDTSSYYWQNPREDTNPHNPGREQHLAGGGATQQIPWAQRAAAQRLSFAGGMLNSPVPGRTDKLNLNVPAGSYVIPSSVVSFLGQDNSAAGAGVLDSMFSSGPAGSKMGGKRNFRSPKARMGKRAAKGFAEGGDVEAPAEEVPIVAAGGEYVVPPEALMEKFGDLDYGHKVMDQFVKEARQKHIKTLKKLPGPER